MALCSRCASIDFGDHIERACSEANFEQGNRYADNRYAHTIIKDIPWVAITQAAGSGCELCVMMRHGMLDVPSRPFVDRIRKETPLLDTTLVEISLSIEQCHPDLAPISAQCYGLCVSIPNETYRRSDCTTLALSSTIPSSPFVSQARSTWNPSLWRSWVDDCTEKHIICIDIQSVSYTPTRLIDVGSDLLEPRLVESCGTLAEYVALSHCWGGSLPLRTTSTNYHTHVEAIPLGDMPATFQDAVKVTRAIGYRYLWIDCLCIIQDSEPDWVRECALMGQVYAGAAVTIAASQSTSPMDGLLKLADGPSLACSIPIYWPSTCENDTLIVDMPPRTRDPSPNAMTVGPLSKRGWTLQERVLSYRMLHMCADGILFQCATCDVTDRLPWPRPPVGGDVSFGTGFLHFDDPREMLGNWYGLVSDYSRRHLTYAKDTLPAISGVARLMGERMGWTYVAGLWSHDIVTGLLWHTADPDIPLAVNASCYPAPSWSWASPNRDLSHSSALVMDGRRIETWVEDRKSLSRLGRRKYAKCLEVRDWTVELVGEDPYAEVKSGQLTVIGNIRPFTLLGDRVSFPSGQIARIIYYPDLEEPSGDPSTARAVWCLLVAFDGGIGSPWKRGHILVLEPVPKRTATFRRIGFMHLICDAETEASISPRDSMADWLFAAENQQIYLV
jgi:diadenosine tetraphosphatase ApaH/serine/threonine PP2A family protein phosphatase